MDDADLPGFAERLVARRTQLNLKPGALAKNGHHAHDDANARKRSQNPSPRTLTKLAKALETSEGYLTGKTGDPDNPRWNVMETSDYEVGLQFHHAPLSVKQRARLTPRTQGGTGPWRRIVGPDINRNPQRRGNG